MLNVDFVTIADYMGLSVEDAMIGDKPVYLEPARIRDLKIVVVTIAEF